jgi:Cu-processing system permease protein
VHLRPSEAPVDVTVVAAVARYELSINARNRWTVVFAVVFGVLVTTIASVGILAEGFTGLQGFTRTSASLLNLVLYIVPLVALVMGTLSFTGDRGSTELLFAQPVTRTEVMLGKTAGLFLAISGSMLAGFVTAGAVIAIGGGAEGLPAYAALVGLALGLALVFLGVAVLVSTASGRKAKAFGVSLFLWFFFVLFYDLLVVGIGTFLRGQAANTFLFLSLFGNPVDLVRVASLITLDNVTIFGAAGAALLRFLGGPAASLLLLIAALFLWAGLPLVAAARALRKQDL